VFKHILIPTDGSKLAEKGVRAGVKLAKALGAKVTGVYVIAPYSMPLYTEGAMYSAGVSADSYKAYSEKAAKKALAAIEIEAQTAGLTCSSHFVTARQPWEGILKTARAQKCDAISMASHGRGGLSGLILGSETARVLANSKVPVVVSR
jgi:nucleotide-binding universal stress UspA family protein